MSMTMSSARDPTARLRAGLNPLLTASLGVYHPTQNSTPLSAASMASASHSSINGFSSAQTPVSAIQPYNPQQWIASPISGHPERPPHHYQESQPSPPPPPPYSPPRSQRPTSMSFDAQQVANISAIRAPPPPAVQHRISPEAVPMANTTFAPPPGTRGASRERRFGLPSFGRRRETEQTSSSPESYPNAHAPAHVPAPHPLSVSSRPHPIVHPGPLTLQIPARSDSDSSQTLPPGARRAVSTPAVASPVSARSRSSSQVRWDQSMGMPLPPPPPGPPPAASRSQSVSMAGENGAPFASPPTRRPPPSGVTALGPVPPTPQNWTDDENVQPRREPSPIRTSIVSEDASITSSNPPDSAVSASTSQASSAAGLARARAQRSEKSLLQRRSESRTRGGVHNSIDASMDVQPLSDIVIPSGSGGLSRRLTITRGTPRSGRTGMSTPQTGDTATSSDAGQESGSTPRAPSSATTQEGPETPTPPFSPQPRRARATPEPHLSIAPKALPTPPPQSRSSSRTPLRSAEASHPAPASPLKTLTRQSVISQSVEQFSRASIDRFQLFAEKEARAVDDADRVRLFAEFFVNESRIRRERYASAISAMGSEIFDLTRDLFRPMAQRRESAVSSTTSAAEFTPQTSEPPKSSRGSTGSTAIRDSPVHPNFTPGSAGSSTPSPSSASQGGQNWQSSNYMPSLSPILSMSASSALDEEDSRGRPASRWWEADSNGEPVRIERSKRESKYMGVPKEAREALQYMDPPEASSSRQPVHDYPPEKTGWRDEEQASTPLQFNPLRNSLLSLSSPNTPNPAHLDCSRLVTLPPPYPRHHPAVNNNHPELASSRDAVRVLSDMTEVEATKAKFLESSTKFRAEAAEAAKQRMQALRQNLQQEIGSGNIGYAEAAGIEADAKLGENAKAKELEKKDFEDFQSVVVMPLNDVLTARIATATRLFEELRGRLFSDTHSSNPNMPQEEGDEEPELLEKLTLLKWIFEAREHLHRAIYDILTDRNDRYREMVLTPYRLSGNADKAASAAAFFAEDAAKRALAFSEEVLHRTQEFRDVVEETVARGVEAQLGAFWDIAPALKRLLDKIPLGSSGGADLRGFAIQIPAGEYDENPAYVDHPMQYLFSLLLHAEKSTYQFIESQTNLLCLLHEVREAVVMAKAKVMENDGRDAVRVEEMKRDEMGRLTDDLKEKVRIVQEQWKDALGDQITLVKERLGGWLLETGGWDESLEDTGVGGVQI